MTYHYANPRHQQPTLVETLLASGERQQTRSRYAADYDTLQALSGSTALAVRELLRTNQVSHLLEQTSWRVRGRDTLLTLGQLTLPRILAPRLVLADRQLRWQSAAPRLRSQFSPSAIQAGSFRYDGAYTVDLVVDRYDPQANVAQVHTPRGTSTSFLWDEVAAQPVAEGKGLTLDQLAYTSFEPGAPGNWLYDRRGRVPGGVTGAWAYTLSPGREVGRSGLTPGQYQLSFWATAAPTVVVDQTPVALPAPVARRGTWALYQLRLSVQDWVHVTSAATSLTVDEVRLHPVGSQLTTATHQPLIGLTSQTGPDGRTVFYEYDGLGRLLRVRDEQDRILSENEYHYARP